MTVHEVVLSGCTPEPLMSYLKALGVLRLVAEQKDPDARGCWREGTFVLRSRLAANDLERFFLEEYRPTPIVVPWSGADFFTVTRTGRGGPFKKTPTGAAVVEALLATASERLKRYRETIAAALSALDSCGIKSKEQMEDKRTKSHFLARLRSTLGEEPVEWIDACAVLSEDKARFSALLGSGGGSDGNAHFSDNFMQNLWEMLPEFDTQREKPAPSSIAVLRSALWARPPAELVPKRTSSLFDAGAVGGVNAGQGFGRVSLGSPWGFMLCLEGTLLLAGCVVRRQGTAEAARAAFPFQVRLTPTRLDSASEQEASGREIWMPVWSASASRAELVALFSEGRASLGAAQATRGVDLARAAASLGVDRGIGAFHRFAIVRGRVGGQNYNTSTPLGRFDVRARPKVDLLREADAWLDGFRGLASGDRVAPRFSRALHAIESSVFELCQYGGPARFAEVLCAFGRAERELATAEKRRKDKNLRPLAGLSADWIGAANDGSVELDLALSLAGIFDQEQKVGPLRSNLEPVAAGVTRRGKPFASWLDKDRSVVWSGADLCTNLTAILERRVMDAGRKGCTFIPLAFRRPASLAAVSTFVAGALDEERLTDLLWGLVLVNHAQQYPALARTRSDGAPPIPRAFALLKLLFLPGPIEMGRSEVAVRPEPGVLALLRAGRLGEACTLGVRRLRASGLVPMPFRSGRRATREDDWGGVVGAVDPRRLGAALLFPVGRDEINRLAALVLRQGEEPAIAVG
jgi:CRISPR-associated protein Csx17